MRSSCASTRSRTSRRSSAPRAGCRPPNAALGGFAHRYKRHGTTTLFAALEVTTGLVKTGHYQRRRRAEFLDFMNEVVAVHPEREIARRPRPPQPPQAQVRPLARPHKNRPLPRHPDLRLLAEHDRDRFSPPSSAMPSPAPALTSPRQQLPRRDRRLRPPPQRQRRSLRMAQDHHPAQAAPALYN